MKVKVLKPQEVEWKEFNDLRSDTACFNQDIQGKFYKGMEHLQNALPKFKEALTASHQYWGRLNKVNGGNLGEARCYDEAVWSKLHAICIAIEGIETLAKDIDPCWTMSLRNYEFKKAGHGESLDAMRDKLSKMEKGTPEYQKLYERYLDCKWAGTPLPEYNPKGL